MRTPGKIRRRGGVPPPSFPAFSSPFPNRGGSEERAGGVLTSDAPRIGGGRPNTRLRPGDGRTGVCPQRRRSFSLAPLRSPQIECHSDASPKEIAQKISFRPVKEIVEATKHCKLPARGTPTATVNRLISSHCFRDQNPQSRMGGHRATEEKQYFNRCFHGVPLACLIQRPLPQFLPPLAKRGAVCYNCA